jgi:hypothetical protein
MTIQHDYGELERLDAHFADQRAQALALQAEAQRAAQEA